MASAPNAAAYGVLSCEQIRELAAAGAILATRPIEDGQHQPASLDLRLGPKAYRVRASFLPGKGRSVEALLAELTYDEIALDGARRRARARLRLCDPAAGEPRSAGRISPAVANPKSSTGRLDIFTRLITDDTEIFDHVAAGYRGPPLCGSLAAQLQRARASGLAARSAALSPARSGDAELTLSDAALAAEHARAPLADGELTLRDGVILRVALDGLGDVVGYRAQKHTDVIDVDRVDHYAVEDYWERLTPRAAASSFSIRMNSIFSPRASASASPRISRPR